MVKAKKKYDYRAEPNKAERRDLEMISLAYFDLFSKFKPKPSKTQLIHWVRRFREQEDEQKK